MSDRRTPTETPILIALVLVTVGYAVATFFQIREILS